MIDLVIPETFSKRESPSGRGHAVVGRRIADDEDDVSKAIATPMAPKGPVKKSPTLSRTGPTPPKAALTPPASRLATLVAVTKRDVPQAARKRAASKGDALPGGKFPIRNRTDLTHAKEDLGFVHGKEHSAAERLIARRSKQLGAVSKAGDPTDKMLKGLSRKFEEMHRPALRNHRRLEVATEATLAATVGGSALAYGKARRDHKKYGLPGHRAPDQAAAWRAKQVSKASGLRYETAEDRRQRRLGAAAGATGIGGALQANAGRRAIRDDTREAIRRTGAVRFVANKPVPEGKRPFVRKAIEKLNEVDLKGTAVVRPRAAGRLAAGGALLGASAGLMREHHKRSWN